jgi:hypothetical protein
LFVSPCCLVIYCRIYPVFPIQCHCQRSVYYNIIYTPTPPKKLPVCYARKKKFPRRFKLFERYRRCPWPVSLHCNRARYNSPLAVLYSNLELLSTVPYGTVVTVPVLAHTVSVKYRAGHSRAKIFECQSR